FGGPRKRRGENFRGCVCSLTPATAGSGRYRLIKRTPPFAALNPGCASRLPAVNSAGMNGAMRFAYCALRTSLADGAGGPPEHPLPDIQRFTHSAYLQTG